MKHAMCVCGSFRNFESEPEKCEFCGSDELILNINVVSDLLNSRSTSKISCGSCDKDLFGIVINAYPHDNGWKVPGLKGTWWLSVECGCGYVTSFDKFGISR